MLCMRILLQRQYRKKAEGWTRIYYTNTNYKKDGVAILLHKTDFKEKAEYREIFYNGG